MEKIKFVYAVANWFADRDALNNIIYKLPDDSEIYWFRQEKDITENPVAIPKNVTIVPFSENATNRAKGKNEIYRYFKEKEYTDRVYLNVIEDGVLVQENVEPVLNAVVNMMQAFKFNSWFNTILDPCNYVLTKYRPRLRIHIDAKTFEKSPWYNKTILWSSNANMFWSVFDLNNITLDKMLLNENFEVPMYYIIEYFAKRRADKDDIGFPFMNLYPTVEEEFATKWITIIKTNTGFSQEAMNKDGKVFAELNLDTSPSLNGDDALEYVYNRLLETLNND